MALKINLGGRKECPERLREEQRQEKSTYRHLTPSFATVEWAADGARVGRRERRAKRGRGRGAFRRSSRSRKKKRYAIAKRSQPHHLKRGKEVSIGYRSSASQTQSTEGRKHLRGEGREENARLLWDRPREKAAIAGDNLRNHCNKNGARPNTLRLQEELKKGGREREKSRKNRFFRPRDPLRNV